jgi:hypothetical protein
VYVFFTLNPRIEDAGLMSTMDGVEAKSLWVVLSGAWWWGVLSPIKITTGKTPINIIFINCFHYYGSLILKF